ncbi:MAG: helix-turn-helix transcriptional regulator [Burkholderiales bacterium]|nr:helix-turn-helix transcriptional regulator [Burkholderiales bacterium]
MSFGYVFEALKAHYRTRGLTYRDVARALRVSEATIKRIFSERDCTLGRLEALCSVAQVDLSQIARGAPRETRLLTRLTQQQEQEIVDDIELFIVAVCAMGNMRFERIIGTYRISEARCISLFAKLDHIGFLELLPNNRYRMLVTRTFHWIPGGPIMHWMKRHLPEYFNHSFNDAGETLRVVNVRVSAESRLALLARIEQVALDYAEQHNADSRLPDEQRLALSLCLAVRSWEPKAFEALRRNPPEQHDMSKSVARSQAGPPGTATTKRRG